MKPKDTMRSSIRAVIDRYPAHDGARPLIDGGKTRLALLLLEACGLVLVEPAQDACAALQNVFREYRNSRKAFSADGVARAVISKYYQLGSPEKMNQFFKLSFDKLELRKIQNKTIECIVDDDAFARTVFENVMSTTSSEILLADSVRDALTRCMCTRTYRNIQSDDERVDILLDVLVSSFPHNFRKSTY